jgi:hypothetical protein
MRVSRCLGTREDATDALLGRCETDLRVGVRVPTRTGLYIRIHQCEYLPMYSVGLKLTRILLQYQLKGSSTLQYSSGLA